MHTLMRFTLVCVCATFLIAGVRESKCEDVAGSAGGAAEEAPDTDESKPSPDLDPEKKQDAKTTLLSGSGRRGGATQPSGNSPRDSQLLSLLAARRRQLLSDRLNAHLSTIAALSQKTLRNNTAFAQLELRDTNSSLIKRIILADNSTAKGSRPHIRIDTPSGTKEGSRLDIRPQDAKPIISFTASKSYQDSKSRAGFINNRKKELTNKSNYTPNQPDVSAISDTIIDGGILYVPELDDKLEGPEQEAVVDPEEEFQVDESNHGVYLLNYSDTNNYTEILRNQIIGENETKENLANNETEIKSTNITKEINTSENQISPSASMVDNTTESNSTDNRAIKHVKIESSKENENNTLFMSDEIYNHFRPMETELPAEDMAPFLFFGQKLSTPFGGDNLTNLPLLSTSTKSVNYISSPSENKKYTSRYSTTDKTKDLSINEEELNEEMDVSVVKNIIEKNKVRNTVKGPAPARHISLLNAYRKPLPSSPTTKIPIILDLNVTIGDGLMKSNLSNFRNNSRGYFNMRRRPVRLTTVETTPLIDLNTTTEKSSTLVYTAVVTSISITSSMKGQNKTEINTNDSEADTNINGTIPLDVHGNTTSIDIALNETLPTTIKPLSPIRTRQRVRIRTTSERTLINQTMSSPTPFVLVNRRIPSNNSEENDQTTNNETNIKQNFPSRRLSDANPSDVVGPRFSLDGILTIDHSNVFKSENEISTTTSARPTSIFRTRRRSTTTSSTVFPTTTSTTTARPLPSQTTLTFGRSEGHTFNGSDTTLTPIMHTTNFLPEISAGEATYYYSEGNLNKNEVKSSEVNTTERTINPIVTTNHKNKENNDSSIRNEEVVIEAEKTYTASYVLAGLGFLPVTAIIVFVLRNIFLKKTKEIDTEYEGYFDDGDVKKESPITPVARLPMPLPVKPDQKWEFPRNKLRLQTLLGQGNFGQVWKAEADDLTGHDGLTRLVAVKTIKETASQKEKQELLHEICIMQKIGTHPNVVTLLACCTEQEPYLLIMEYVMCGKLLTYLRERRSRPDRFGGGSGALTSRDLTVFAYCVARGMEYLASKGIVHRDLAARNVLVDHNKLCKIADFGMSRETSSTSASPEERSGAGRAPRHALPVRWMAPEALLYNVFNHETDVWAYGILLWEIVTLGSTPYASMSGREVLQVVTEGYRLERPAHCKPALYRTMHACWHAAAAQRPPFADIKAELAELLDNEPSEGNYVDLDSFYQDSSVYSDPSAIIQDDGGISVEYSAELKPEQIQMDLPRRSFNKSTGNLQRNLSSGNYDGRNFGFRDDSFSPVRSNFGIGSPRMGGFGIRDMGFRDQNFNKTKETKLSGSSFQREREARDNPLVSRNSFSGGFQRMGSRDSRGFQLISDGARNKRVPEFECDI